jgi:DtxR family Mn-dependent transcriptional regulator
VCRVGRQEPPVETWKEFDQNVITHSAAHHLMAIDDLVGRLGYARVSDIARRLNITRGSVSISLQPLKKAGLVHQDENRHLRLTAAGQALVDAIKTKRHLMQRLLAEVLGVAPAQAEIDACKLEHLVSNETAQRLLSFLRFLDGDPARARELVAAWRAADPTCAGAPAACPSCESECLASRLERFGSQGNRP